MWAPRQQMLRWSIATKMEVGEGSNKDPLRCAMSSPFRSRWRCPVPRDLQPCMTNQQHVRLLSSSDINVWWSLYKHLEGKSEGCVTGVVIAACYTSRDAFSAQFRKCLHRTRRDCSSYIKPTEHNIFRHSQDRNSKNRHQTMPP